MNKGVGGHQKVIGNCLKRKCGIIMPFGIKDLEDLYNEFILMEDKKAAIATADLVIADLSGQNPNVFYEVGIAHTLGKPVLLLARHRVTVAKCLRAT
jgi:nucleoside 2-deoxyribosyltransferase